MTGFIKGLIFSVYRFLVPDDIALRYRRLELTVWAFLLSLSFYPGYLGFLAWFSLARPAMIIARLQGGEAFRASYFFGFLFNAFTIYWVWIVTPPGAIAAITIVGFYYAAMLVTFSRVYRLKPLLGVISLPILWTGLEYFRTLTQFAFPWSDLGYSQADYLYILQSVSLISVHGLTFLIVAVNVIIWQILRRDLSGERRITASYTALGIVALLTAIGWAMLPAYPVPGDFKVGVLQGAVPLKLKWSEGNEAHSFRVYDSLTQSVADSGVMLFVWPETAAPSYLSHDLPNQRRVGEIARSSSAYHLVGALGARRVGGEVQTFNSCYQFSPEGRMQSRHDKVKLVPFSEQVPYPDYLPFLRKDVLTEYLTFIETYDVQWWSDFKPGDSIVLFQMPDATYGAAICFESAFPEHIRAMILKGANFIVGITNDTWFGHSVGIYMHSRILRTRAVENRVWMARAANTGISYIVDGYGRIRDELPLDVPTAMVGKIRLLEDYSFFTRYGDLVGLVSLLLSAATLVILIFIWVARKLFRSGSS